MRIISALFLFALLVVLIALACVNAEIVTINYYFDKIQMALSVALAFSLIAGFIIGLFVAFLVFLKQKSRQSKLKQQLRAMEHELKTLRVLATKDT